MMFQQPPLKVNLPKPKMKKTEVKTECGQRAVCEKRDTYLDMSQMALKLLPSSIERCDCLVELVLSRNYLRDLPRELLALESLETLDVSCNKFQEVPLVLFSLLELRELDLSSNNITEVPLDIRYLKSLKTLKLNKNRIRRLPNNMQHLKCLVYFDVSFNKLTEYPEALCTSWPRLNYLNMSNNLLSELPYDITKLTDTLIRKDKLDMRNNPFTEPPADVCAKGLEAIRDYLEPMWRGMKEFKNRKLLDKIKVEGSKGYRPLGWNIETEERPLGEAFAQAAELAVTAEETKQRVKSLSKGGKKQQAEKAKQQAAKKPISAVKDKPKSSKIVSTKKSKSPTKSTRKSPFDSPVPHELDDSSQVTLVEVYGDSNSIELLSPLPDSKTPAGDIPEDDGFSQDDDDAESDLLDLINESYEPPDLDIPDSMMGNFGGGRSSGGGGGGMLEQWLGTVQSMTVSPTTRAGSRDSLTIEGMETPASAGENMIYTPFSEVKINRRSESSISGHSGSDRLADLDDRLSGGDAPRDMQAMLAELDNDVREGRRSYDGMSQSDLERLSVIFSDEAADINRTTQKSDPATEGFDTEQGGRASDSQITGVNKDVKKKTMKKMKSLSSMLGATNRRSSTASFGSIGGASNKSSSPKKKKTKKKRRKKGKQQLTEMEMYSRIPFRPLMITPRTAPCSRGLRTWCYFREPESCYLLNNYTGEDVDRRTVTFGTDEVTVISSPSLHSIQAFSEADSLTANNSSISVCDSRQNCVSDNSQALSNLDRSECNTADLLSEQGSGHYSSSVFGSQLLSPTNINMRPSSLPPPLHHTWTNEDLAKYIYKPSSLIIPPNVLITYFEMGDVDKNHVIKLVNTLELYGFGECYCDLLLDKNNNEHNFEKEGYVDWLDEKAAQAEFIIVILSKKYNQSLPFITRLDSYVPPRLRTSPYVTMADAKRWGLNPAEVQRKFIPVYHDDCDGMVLPPWLVTTPFFVPSELCELGYHLISRDCRDAIVIPNIFGDNECKEDTVSEAESTCLKEKSEEGEEEQLVNVYRISPVTAHLTVNPTEIPPDWRLEEIGGKIRHHWKTFSRTCGFDAMIVTEIDTVYNGMLAKSVQCLRTWKQDLVGRANYEELARRLDQVGLKHIMEAYCTFGSFSNTNFQQR